MFINIPIHFIDTYIHALESLEGEKPVGQYLVTRPITDLGLGLFLKQGITQREKSKFKPKSKYLTSFENYPRSNKILCFFLFPSNTIS